MDSQIRRETAADYSEIAGLIEAAFREDLHSDHLEQFLVQRLRHSPAFIPELALVALREGRVVGHILLSKVLIRGKEQEVEVLSLAPVSVLPEFQGKGIGSALIREAHRRAETLGYAAVVLLGHEGYYPRFGYEMAKNYGIRFPFEAPEANCMVLELRENALAGMQGMVVYPEAFFGK